MKNFVVAQDGVRVRLEGPCLEGWVKPKNFEDLQSYAEKPLDTERYPGPKWIGSKMPASLMKQVLGTIHEFPHMETAFSLYYNALDGKWAVKCPEQSGAGASVSFYDDGTGMPEGFTLCGSIHTHPEMAAFWSGTDLTDQQFKAGIHIVFGLRNGLVHENKCTVFLPSTQEDQDIWSVVEEVDFNEVNEPVAEWVETIKRQSYHRPVTYKYYGGHYNTNKKLPPGHYGSTLTGSSNSYAGYDYDYGYPYRKQDTSWWYGYANYDDGWGSDWSDYSSWYGSKKTKNKKQEGTFEVSLDVDTADLKDALLEVLEDSDASIRFSSALLEPEVRGPLEHVLGVAVTDTFDRADILMSIEEFMTGETVLTDITNEEATQIFEGLMDLRDDLNVVDPRNATGNDINIESLCRLMERAAESYTDSECVSADVVSNWLNTLRNAYETVLAAQAAHGSSAEVEAEEVEC